MADYVKNFSLYLLKHYEEELKEDKIKEIVKDLIDPWQYEKNRYSMIPEIFETKDVYSEEFNSFIFYCFKVEYHINIKLDWFITILNTSRCFNLIAPKAININYQTFDIDENDFESRPSIAHFGIYGFPVKHISLPSSIDSFLCRNNPVIEEINLPSTLTGLRYRNIMDCPNLVKITSEVGYVDPPQVFYDCPKLKEFNINQPVRNPYWILNWFKDCPSLEEINYCGSVSQFGGNKPWIENETNIKRINCSDGIINVAEWLSKSN